MFAVRFAQFAFLALALLGARVQLRAQSLVRTDPFRNNFVRTSFAFPHLDSAEAAPSHLFFFGGEVFPGSYS